MAIIVITSRPVSLLRKLKTEVQEGRAGDEWQVDSDGDFFRKPVATASPRAWMRPVTQDGSLVLKILAPRGTTISKRTYALAHSRFVEMLLSYFDDSFEQVTTTALPAHGD